MGHVHAESIIDRLQPRVIIPHHYYIWDVLQRQSTLQVADEWVNSREQVKRISGPTQMYEIKSNTADVQKLMYDGANNVRSTYP